jgi:hypothetical protein
MFLRSRAVPGLGGAPLAVEEVEKEVINGS